MYCVGIAAFAPNLLYIEPSPLSFHTPTFGNPPWSVHASYQYIKPPSPLFLFFILTLMAQMLSGACVCGLWELTIARRHICPSQPELVACMRFRPHAPSKYFPVLVRSSEWPGSFFWSFNRANPNPNCLHHVLRKGASDESLDLLRTIHLCSLLSHTANKYTHKTDVSDL